MHFRLVALKWKKMSSFERGWDKAILCLFASGLFQRTDKMLRTDQVSGLQIKEFARKNAANALSVANMVMGMASIISSLHGWVKKQKNKKEIGRYWMACCGELGTLGCSRAKTKRVAFSCCCLLVKTQMKTVNRNNQLLTFLVSFWEHISHTAESQLSKL